MSITPLFFRRPGHHCIDLKEAPEHTLKRCVQDEIRNIDCQEIKADRRDMISQWPPGPYVIPMSRYGCPESSMHGWREGYILLIWQNPQSVHVQTDILNDSADDGTDVFASVSMEPLLSTSPKHFLHIPPTQTYVKLTFCYKYRSNVSVDIGSWPEENYSIMGTENDCPKEFSMTYSNFSIPNLTDWNAVGYLPDFKIYKEGIKDYLQLKMCSRQKGSDNSSFDDETSLNEHEHSLDNNKPQLYRNWTCFFLVKNSNTPCPIFRQTVMFMEKLFIELQDGGGTTMLHPFCFYELRPDEKSWLFESRRKHAYGVSVAEISEGNITEVGERRTGFFFFVQVTKIHIVHFWKIFDLGTTRLISAVDITVHRDFDEIMNHICPTRLFGCLVSREKWSFLYSEAFSCLYVPYCRVTGLSATLVFKRILEGRYITLAHKEEFDIGDKMLASFNYYVDIFIEPIAFGKSKYCDVDLGMQNLNIKDEQISASSWLEGFSPSQARPYSRGWCPAFDDREAYLRVDFPLTTTIEGLTVYEYDTSNSIIRKRPTAFAPLLTLSYSDNNNATNRIKVLNSDATKMKEGSQTFLFLRPIHVQSVNLIVNSEDILSGSSCLRFELHGCTPNGNGSISVFNRRRKVPPFELFGYMSEILEPGSILTSIGYPKRYQNMESYKWIIRFPESKFIKLIFTQIDFCAQRDFFRNRESDCIDSLTISKDLVNVKLDSSRVIDNRFVIKDHSISVETKETQLVLTFVSCFVSSPINRGNGFKAIAMHQDIPTCFSVDGRHYQWIEGLLEICRHPSMFIKSMSYLGFPFINTMERWTISAPTKRINLQMLDFSVPCATYETNPPFRIIDMTKEMSYCNIYKPPYSYNSSFDNVTVVFFKGVDQVDKDHVTYIEGFKMFYSFIEEQEERLISTLDKLPESKNLINLPGLILCNSEVCKILEIYRTFETGLSLMGNNMSKKLRNVALYKPALLYIWVIGDSESAAGFVDGLTTFEKQFSSSTDAFPFFKEIDPVEAHHTVIIDLEDLYTLDYVVLYGGPIINVTCVNTLLTGIAIFEMKSTGHFNGSFTGGRAIHQKGIMTRFVRLDFFVNIQ